MEIQSNSRILICGKTRTGKTTLAKKVLFPQYTRRIFWDVKIENNDLLPNCSLCTTPAELEAALQHGKVSILYQPRSLDIHDFDRVCEIVFNAGNFTLFIDEVATVCTPSIIAPWYNQILIRGASRGIGCINITQRPRACYNTILSEAEYFFIFRLQLETDVSKIKQVVPREHLENIYSMPYYCSLFIDTLNDEIRYLKPIRGV